MCASRGARTSGYIGHNAWKVSKISAVLQIQIRNMESVNSHIISIKWRIACLYSGGYSYTGVGNGKLCIAEIKITAACYIAVPAAIPIFIKIAFSVSPAFAVSVSISVSDDKLLRKAWRCCGQRHNQRTGGTCIIIKNLVKKHKIFSSAVRIIF